MLFNTWATSSLKAEIFQLDSDALKSAEAELRVSKERTSHYASISAVFDLASAF